MSSISSLERFLATSRTSLHLKVFDRLSAADVVRLSKTSTLIRDALKIYKERKWNIDEFLACWFEDGQSFRATMALAGAVISGSQALRFMDRLGPAPRSDLDVVTRVGGVLALARYIESQGYKRVERPAQPGDKYPLITDVLSMTSSSRFCSGGGRDGIVEIFDFERPTWGVLNQFTPTLKVQIIAVTQNPVHHLIYTPTTPVRIGFRSYCKLANLWFLVQPTALVMNYLSHKEAVSIFPRATFLEKTAYPSSRPNLGSEWDSAWKIKYKRRGYRVVTDNSAPSLVLGERHSKDGQCWIIPFSKSQRAVTAREEARSQYKEGSDAKEAFELSLLHEKGKGDKVRYRLGVFEPEVWGYLYPWYILQ
ncbi:hypothetical protein DFP72DRAFT_851533 [Ephemerocybe angulata]|uniref:Uncharacterized protein n=1 Tax=Ephemerocybe angulata TaxID=980116 RepID=A0A8H6HQZ8_9AGAR|nr:hypothetical protein DFP72DRAFT_851533 [Tulosesus angulatus]